MIKAQVQKIIVYGLIINNKGEILLIQRSPHDSMPGVWEMPGGGLEFGEDPINGVKREVKEECGIDIQVLHPVAVQSHVNQKEEPVRQFIRIAYLCQWREGLKIALSSDHTAFQWADRKDLPEKLSSFLKQTLQDIKRELV